MNKRIFSGPFLVFMLCGTIIPLGVIAFYGMTDRSGTFTLDNITAIATGEHWQALMLALGLALISTIICLVIAFPLGLILKDSRLGKKGFMVFIFILPMWMNFLLRTYAWMSILENTGLLNRFFDAIGLFDLINGLFGTEIEYFKMINTQGAVVLGMVYNYLPFMILPIYSVIVKLDYSLLEAARDLGANNVTVFRKVILPLSLPGVLSGITMVFVPSVSTFAISRMLGGGTELLLGDLIERQFLGGAYNPQLGAAISLVMMIIVLVCMLVMNRFGEGEEQAVML